jgi:hypothetical protein
MRVGDQLGGVGAFLSRSPEAGRMATRGRPEQRQMADTSMMQFCFMRSERRDHSIGGVRVRFSGDRSVSSADTDNIRSQRVHVG